MLLVLSGRYRLYGDVSAKAAAELCKPGVADHFARLIQRVAPKSYAQVRRLGCNLFCLRVLFWQR